MANSHATQAKISMLKKTPAAYAQGLCDSVRKFFAACQENIYSLSRKYLQPIQKIFTVCQKDSHCTVRNILRVQSERFLQCYQKDSYSAIRKTPTVLSGKSPQYTRKKTCKCARKYYFGMKFTQIARISRFAVVCALLLCVCGATRAWGLTYTWTGGGGDNKWKNAANWTDDEGKNDYPGSNWGGIYIASDISIVVNNVKVQADDTINIAIFGNTFTVSFLGTGSIEALSLAGSNGVDYNNYANINFEIKEFTVKDANLAYSISTINPQSTFNIKNKLSNTEQIAANYYRRFELTNYGTLDLSNAEIDLQPSTDTGATFSFTNNGTIRLIGTQQNTSADKIQHSANSTVEFYGTGNADISKMGNTFQNLSVKINAGETKTVTFPAGATTVIGNMTITGGGDTSRITVTGTNANISLAAGNTGVGSWLNIDYNSVSINGGSTTNTYDVRTNCFDVTGASAYDNKNGWLFPPTPYTSDIYFWVGGGGDNNWGTRGNWKYDSATGVSANEAPGTKPNAEVHIEPTATETVTLNVLPANSIKSITIGNNGTLALGASNLTVQSTWSNSGTVTVTSGNATLPTGSTDNGTWRYENTVARDLINITYNNLNINGINGNITAPNNVVANGTVEIARNCVLIAESGFKSANLYVRGRFQANANSNVEITDTLHTFHDDNRTNWGTVRVYSHQIKAKNIINEKTIYLFTAGTSGTIEILTDNFNNKFSKGDYWGNRCGEIVTSSGNMGSTRLPVKIVGYDGISPTTVENTGLMIFDNGLTVIGTLTNNVATGGTPGSITIGSGTSSISGNLTNAGTISITSANTTLNVTGTTTNSGTFTNNANAGVTFNSNNTFTNTGTVTNNPGATFNMNAPLTNNGAAIITNKGTFNFQTGTFTNETNATFANDNTVKIKSGAVVTNNGTITNGTTSTVEYYGDAANTTATPNFGTAYHNLIATTANGLRSFNFDKDITVNGDMTLSGANGNRLVIDGTSGTNITLSPANMQTGDWLQINYNNVSVNAQSFSPAYKVENSVDGAGNRAFGLQRGWQFPENNLYYWVNGTGNNDWTEPNNWRLGSPTSTSAPVTYPGNASRTPATTNAEVFISQISPAANIILNTTATINAIEITDANATLALGTNDLTVNNSWSNRGKITLESGNVNFGASASITENGTWSYNNTASRNLANIAYNNLELAGTNTNTITPTAAITANSVSINTNTTLVLGANDLTVRNSWSNSGTVTITSGNANLPAGTTDNGTWTYNNTTSRSLANIVYNNLELSGTNINTITPAAAVTANNININSNTTLALGANNLSVRGVASNSWTNSGTVTVTSGNATFATPATDSGTWTYNNTSSRSLINLKYNDLNLDGTNTNTITPIADVSATGTITISGATTFDLASRDISTATIENKGTVRLHGTQSVTGANNTGKPTFTGGNSGNVEFYGNTGGVSIDVSKMGSSYDNLTVNGYNKTLEFTGTTNVAGNLILKGANDNAPLTIVANAASAAINVTNSQQSNEGQYLRIDRANVTISGSPFEPNTSYYARNSYDTDETTDAALESVRGGWKIDIPIQLTNMLLSVAPIGGNTVYVRATQTTMDGLSGVPSGLIANMLKRFFKIYDATAVVSSITVANASLVRNSSKVTWIRLSLSGLGSITVSDLQKYYVRTYTNAASAGSTEGFHQISDFAVGAVNPLFAYDNRYADSDANWQSSATTSSVAVRNWDAGQGNTGSLLSKKDIVMSVRLAGGADNAMGNPVLYLSNNPSSGSQSNNYNGATNSSWRVWLPDVAEVGELATVPNGNKIDSSSGSITVSGSGTNPVFNIPAGSNSIYGNWKDGDQITFMFGVTDAGSGNLIEVGGDRGTGKHNLYALRLREPGDINSLDLWSIRLRGMTAHRGGVSIRNNVINVTTGEQVTVEVDMPTSGTLNVMVMTLDGSIVKYLQHGTASEGKHAYHWGGLTNSGSPVARGLYFIRVVGSGIDETRKVMVVK